jgi:hypothetical protein
MPNNFTNLSMSDTSSANDMFTTSANYIKNKTSTFTWEQIIIICLSILLIFCIFNNQFKNRIINTQNSVIRRSISRSISNNNDSPYDD